jgi:membrane protease YdiL (CAAX protease family)
MSNPSKPRLSRGVTQSKQEPSPHDRKALYKLTLVIAILLLTLVLSMYSGKDVYIFGYIMVIVYALHGPVRHHQSWQELGLKHGFMKDLRRVWYYVSIDAFLFQILPPTFGLAIIFGYYPELVSHITGRLSINFGSLEGISAIGGLLAAALVLTLIEEVVFRVTIQEKLSWFIGTPIAILFTSVIFGLIHTVGTSGSLPIILLDVTGVALDGVFFGIIYAKTKNLALTWTTHYIADVIGLIALVLIF